MSVVCTYLTDDLQERIFSPRVTSRKLLLSHEVTFVETEEKQRRAEIRINCSPSTCGKLGVIKVACDRSDRNYCVIRRCQLQRGGCLTNNHYIRRHDRPIDQSSLSPINDVDGRHGSFFGHRVCLVKPHERRFRARGFDPLSVSRPRTY